MIQSANTVVGWDGSESSSHALDWAATREAARGGVLTIARAQGDFAPGPVIGDRQFAAAGEVTVAKAAALRRAFPRLTIRTEVRRGTILDLLEELSNSADLIVVGTHRGAEERLRFGRSVGVRLAAIANSAVAIIPSEIVGSRSGVVVGIDDSPTSPTVAWFAAAEAARRGEPLRVVHAWIAPTGWGNGVVLDDELVADIEESHRQTVDAAVDRITADFPGLDVTGFTVRGLASRKLFHSDPAPALVVVGSRAHTNFPIVRLGSVTYNVLLNLDAPTIVVRTPIETEHRSGQSSRLVSQR